MRVYHHKPNVKQGSALRVPRFWLDWLDCRKSFVSFVGLVVELGWLVGMVGWDGWLGWLVGMVGWLGWLVVVVGLTLKKLQEKRYSNVTDRTMKKGNYKRP